MALINLKSDLTYKDPIKQATFFSRIATDFKRMARILDPTTSPGFMFSLKQVGLQLINPKIQYGLPDDITIFPTRLFTPVNTLLSSVSSPLGIHPYRHGILPFPLNQVKSSYGAYTKFNNLPGKALESNRLILLRKDLLEDKTQQPRMSAILRMANAVNNALTLKDNKFEVISRLSGLGGPNSAFGIGATLIHRYEQTRTLYDYKPYAKNIYNSNVAPILNDPIDKENKTNINTNPKAIEDNFHGNNVSMLSQTPANQKYISLKYRDLKKNADEMDFAQTILKKVYAKPYFIPDLEKSKTPYREFSWEGKYGLPITGDISKNNRSNFTNKLDKFDLINMLEIGQELPSYHRDFIKFFFTDIDGNNKITFRAIFANGFTDSFTGNWASSTVLGKADSIHTYQSYSRDVSFAFKIATNTREELMNNYVKINELISYTAPKYLSNNRMVGPLMKLTIGDYFKATPGFITSIAPTIGESTWEINLEGTLMQVPHHMDVDISYTVIGNSKPELHGKILDAVRRN